VLDVSEDSVRFLSGLLDTERLRRRTRTDTRALTTEQQALLVLRWFLDDTRMIQLARDNGIGRSTAYAYHGEADLLRIPIKKTNGASLTADQPAYNAVHGALRALGERANSLLKTTFKVLRRYRGCPWRIGDIVAAALVLLHVEHQRTT
jgi:DDE superfamily endonuclease